MANSNTRVTGIGWVVSINTSGNNSSPTWAPVAASQQKKLDLTFKTNIIKTTGKGDSGAETKIPGIRDAMFTFDASTILSDAAYALCKTNWHTNVESYIQISKNNSTNYVMNTLISDIKESAPVDGEVVTSFTFEVTGDMVTFA